MSYDLLQNVGACLEITLSEGKKETPKDARS